MDYVVYFVRVIALEHGLQGDHLIQDRAQRPQVCPEVVLALDPLWRGIANGQELSRQDIYVLLLLHLSTAEVGDFAVSILDKDVLRLQVVMYEGVLFVLISGMAVVESLGDLFQPQQN